MNPKNYIIAMVICTDIFFFHHENACEAIEMFRKW